MTPRDRRFVRIVGFGLIVLAIVTALQALAINRTANEQRACLSDNFRSLTETLTKRAELSTQETEASKRVWLVYAEAAGLLRDDPTEPLPPDDAERLQRELVDSLIDYEATINAVARERRDNPVPPYPEGECE